MRLSITRRSDLAIRAIRALAGRSGLPGPELADAIGTSRGFLAQIMVPLVRARWVASTAGRSGGYRLLPAGRTVSVLDVIEVIEGSAVASRPFEAADARACVLAPHAACATGPDPAHQPCDIHEAWLAAERALVAELRARLVLPATAAADDTDPGS